MAVDQLLEELNKLSDDAIAAAQAKADELSFDKDKGEIPWAETITNLTFSRDILTQLVVQGQLQQIPLTIQKLLLDEVTAIGRHLSELTNNSNDTTKNISTSVEKLYTTIWQNQLNRLSPEFIGYETRNNQLKNLITQAQKLNDDLKNNIGLRDKLAIVLDDAVKDRIAIKEHLNTSVENENQITDKLKKTSEMESEATGKIKTIKETSDEAEKELAKSTKSSAQILEIEGRIRAFFGEVDEYKKNISDTKLFADDTVKSNNDQKESFIRELRDLQIDTRDQLEKATGVSLFKAFDARRRVLVIAKNKWIKYISVLIIAVIIYSGSIIFMYANDGFSDKFLQRLLLNLPLLLTIYFCLSQYNKERKLEEEYAFKSNISVSLVPYEELVRKLMKDDPDERKLYTKFLIDSITEVYSSPTEKILHDHQTEKRKFSIGRTTKPVSEVLNSLKELIKTAKE